MKILFYVAVFCIVLFPSSSPATRHTITNSGFTFVPSTLTIQEGDTVVFSISGSHNAVEVSQTTWNANGATALPGGFSIGFGGGTLPGLTAGTHYYVCTPHVGLGMKAQIIVTPLTGVGDVAGPTPREFDLSQNYPNPFNPSTTIAFTLARTVYAEIAVYDALGRLMKVLIAEVLPSGTHSVTWDATDADGRAAVSGPYFVRMRAGEGSAGFSATKKILLMR